MKNAALLIIDVQEAMFSIEEFVPYKGKRLLKNISEMILKARVKGIPVIYIQHTKDDGPFKENTEGWKIQSSIAPVNGDYIIQKSFCDSFQETKLKETLDQMKIENLIIMGMQTEFCVDTTVRSAFNRGYKNILVSDAHTTFDNEILDGEKVVAHHNRVLASFGEIKKIDEIEFLKKYI